ncbi:O-antigen ligase family protein [Mycolicibacterium iranicum]|uniref:O-antigen ligase family protein n=1 Tax=Mycolicibacterium iranicum TaxID=912594 RepID=UPI0009DC3F41|nr:O-antigen ligase family protein [Mycolicibacterium iranicum]
MTPRKNSRQGQLTSAVGHQPAGKWMLATILWSAILFFVPINYALPGVMRALWFVLIFGLIVISALCLRVAPPQYPVLWLFAGYASLTATVTATRTATVSENWFVGGQLVVLLGLGTFVLSYNVKIDRQFSGRVSFAFLMGQTLSSAVAISQLLGLAVNVPGSIYGVVGGRASGMTEHPNTLGLMSCVGSLLALYTLLVSQKWRFAALVALLTNLVALVASGSLTAVLSLIIGLAILVLSMRDYLGRMAIWSIAFMAVSSLAIGLSGILAYLPSLTDRYAQVTGRDSDQSSWEIRLRTYRFAWEAIVKDPIFGNGLDIQSSGTFNGMIAAHNSILRSWYQGGVALALAFTLIALAFLWIVIRSLLKKQQSIQASLLAALLVYAMVSPVLEQRQFWIPAIIVWASLSAVRETSTIGTKTSATRQQRADHYKPISL